MAPSSSEQTVDHDPRIKSQLALSNQLQGRVRCKFGHVTLAILHLVFEAVIEHDGGPFVPRGPLPPDADAKLPGRRRRRRNLDAEVGPAPQPPPLRLSRLLDSGQAGVTGVPRS